MHAGRLEPGLDTRQFKPTALARWAIEPVANAFGFMPRVLYT